MADFTDHFACLLGMLNYCVGLISYPIGEIENPN